MACPTVAWPCDSLSAISARYAHSLRERSNAHFFLGASPIAKQAAPTAIRSASEQRCQLMALNGVFIPRRPNQEEFP